MAAAPQSPLDYVERIWRGMNDIERAQLVGGGLICVSLFGLRGSALLFVVLGVLSQKKPSVTAFHVFFENWFKTAFVPQLTSKLSQELSERAKRRSSILDSLKDSATSWLVENSRGIQTAMLWESVTTRSLPTLRVYDVFFMRVAVINLGSANQPIPVSFWGVYDNWYLSPFMRLDFDGVSVLDTLERREQ